MASHPTTRMHTRSKNANAHPGLVNVSTVAKRVRDGLMTKKAIAAEKKVAAKEKRDDAVLKIAGIERRNVEQEALDETPRANTTSHQLGRTTTYKVLPPTSDENSSSEMDIDVPLESTNNREVECGDTDNSRSSDNAPPKKKAKRKHGIRDSIKDLVDSGELKKAKGKAPVSKSRGEQEREDFARELEEVSEVSVL